MLGTTPKARHGLTPASLYPVGDATAMAVSSNQAPRTSGATTL